MGNAGFCNPTLPCGTSILSCPCGPTEPSVPSLGKSGKSSSLSGICGNIGDCGETGEPACLPECCGVDGYPPCWFYTVVAGTPTGYGDGTCYPIGSGPACCGFGPFPPCGTSLATCGNVDGDLGLEPFCCGFEFYPPCTCDVCFLVGEGEGGEGCCGAPSFPTCPSSGISGKSNKGSMNYIYPFDLDCLLGGGLTSGSFFGKPSASGILNSYLGHNGEHTSTTSQLTMEQLSAEVDSAVEEAVEHMVNINELNVYEGEVNVYKYADDGEADVVNIVASEGLN